jgi:CRP-like cAMP-binding protein
MKFKTMKEQEILIEFAKKHIEISTEDEEKIKKYFKVRNVEKNEILLNAGEVCNHLYFVVQGILRTFHLNANGTEFTRLIRKENQFCTVLLSFLEKKSSVATIQALEKGVLLVISSEDFRTLTKESEIAQKMYTKTLEDFENFHLKRLEFLTSYSPKEKTEIFLKEYHELEPRLTDKVIASYLQITPETYCRCKKSLES